MKIKTITCHNVYNVGASLQSYALLFYLKGLGHDVEIIDYQPEYLRHYQLWRVNNSFFDKIFLKQIYLLLKLPERIKTRNEKRKRKFDEFTREYLTTTENTYWSFEELEKNPPEADVFFAGSDQIWNPLFPNGKDPAFYLEFVNKDSVKASYAASMAVDRISKEFGEKFRIRLKNMDYLAVRETSALQIIKKLGIQSVYQVMDPVFLMDSYEWSNINSNLNLNEKYILLYDFDNNEEVLKLVKEIAQKYQWKIYSVLNSKECDRCFNQEGPIEFVDLIRKAELVVSNSFHATAFSIIFEKDFLVFQRREHINTRMLDLLLMLGLSERVVTNMKNISNLEKINYKKVNSILREKIAKSKEYIDKVLEEKF